MLPTFDCKRARHAVEKAICSDPDLARLDRQIDDAYKAALARRDRKTIDSVRDDQREFLGARNKQFGKPEYNLRKAMEQRLAALRGLTERN